MQIKILTGPVHTGKTTCMAAHCAHNKSISGILSPVINNIRHFQNIQTGETFSMIANETETNVLQIGRYRFSANAFQRAHTIITTAVSKNCPSLIIDEIGPLELQNKGFALTLNNILQTPPAALTTLWLIIRDTHMQQVCSHFHITNPQIILLPTA